MMGNTWAGRPTCTALSPHSLPRSSFSWATRFKVFTARCSTTSASNPFHCPTPARSPSHFQHSSPPSPTPLARGPSVGSMPPPTSTASIRSSTTSARRWTCGIIRCSTSSRSQRGTTRAVPSSSRRRPSPAAAWRSAPEPTASSPRRDSMFPTTPSTSSTPGPHSKTRSAAMVSRSAFSSMARKSSARHTTPPAGMKRSST